jgi:hypothetical protein
MKILGYGFREWTDNDGNWIDHRFDTIEEAMAKWRELFGDTRIMYINTIVEV